MPPKMMSFTKPRAIGKPCCKTRFESPEVAICTENIVIPALGAGILFNAERLEYQPEYLIQHLSVCLLLHIPPLLMYIAVLDFNQQESDHHDSVRSGHLADLQR